VIYEELGSYVAGQSDKADCTDDGTGEEFDGSSEVGTDAVFECKVIVLH
jgi:hypothetical protein